MNGHTRDSRDGGGDGNEIEDGNGNEDDDGGEKGSGNGDENRDKGGEERAWEPCFLFFFHLAYSRWAPLPSCLWSLRIFPSLPGSRLTNYYRDASSALLSQSPR